MRLTELMSVLDTFRREYGDVEVCVYDSVIEDYTSRLCLEVVDDDHFINEDDLAVSGERMLLL